MSLKIKSVVALALSAAMLFSTAACGTSDASKSGDSSDSSNTTTGYDVSTIEKDDELDKLLQAGVTPVQLSGGRMCALRILTTRATAEGPEGESFRSLNATLVTDELLRDLRAALAARFRAAQNSTLTRTAIRSAVLLVLQDYRARGWLSAFGDLRVYADAGDASLCRVEFTYSIPAGLHRIALSAQMTG